MEKTEPTLVPEWLKTSGSGTTSHQSGSSSSLNSDDHVLSKLSKSKLSVIMNDHDRTTTTSSYFRRSPNGSSSTFSTNGSSNLRSYNSFGRPHQRDREKDVYEYHDKEKSRDYFNSLGNILPNRFDREGLKRSQSMISSKRGYNTVNKIIHNNGSQIRNVNKAAFERNFPSLSSGEERPEIGRVPSPVIQSLPPSVIGGDGWTSALAEVPVIAGSNGSSASPVNVNSTFLGTSSNSGLNMAETLAQGPSKVQTQPQLSVETQRLEELAIKQSRQLIPMISSAKALVLNPLDKTKSKVGPHQHQNPSSLSPHGVLTKPEIAKTVNTGKLLVLAREKNGNSPIAKDSSSSPKSVAKPVITPPAPGSAPVRNSVTRPITAITDRKPSALPISEKRLAPQAQSRNEFFNLMRKKSMASPQSSLKEGEVAGSSVAEVQDRTSEINGGDRVSDVFENGTNDSDSVLDSVLDSDVILPPPEEEEAAFLRSLGWDENAGEEGGLTEEEIKAFEKLYMERKNSRPRSGN